MSIKSFKVEVVFCNCRFCYLFILDVVDNFDLYILGEKNQLSSLNKIMLNFSLIFVFIQLSIPSNAFSEKKMF